MVEIISPDKPECDLIEKRYDYAEAQIPESWIVDPRDETITVLRLQGGTYVEHGVFRRGSQAASALLDGFMVQVDALFDATSFCPVLAIAQRQGRLLELQRTYR